MRNYSMSWKVPLRVTVAIIGMVILLAMGVLALQSFASSVSCNCSAYATGNLTYTVVIDNQSGWHEAKYGSAHDWPPSDLRLDLTLRSPETDRGSSEVCSSGAMRCVYLKRMRAVIAFQRGEAGDTFQAKGVTFEIKRKIKLPGGDNAFIYVVTFQPPDPLRRGWFLYSDLRGVVSLSFDDTRPLKGLPIFLVHGPGLLARDGYGG